MLHFTWTRSLHTTCDSAKSVNVCDFVIGQGDVACSDEICGHFYAVHWTIIILYLAIFNGPILWLAEYDMWQDLQEQSLQTDAWFNVHGMKKHPRHSAKSPSRPDILQCKRRVADKWLIDWLIFIKARNKRTCNEYNHSDNESDTWWRAVINWTHGPTHVCQPHPADWRPEIHYLSVSAVTSLASSATSGNSFGGHQR